MTTSERWRRYGDTAVPLVEGGNAVSFSMQHEWRIIITQCPLKAV